MVRAHTAVFPLGSQTIKISDIEVAIFDQHRTAFFHWARWRNSKHACPPILITFDRHHDLGYPEAATQKLLRNMKRKNMKQIALATWQSLAKENDDQLLAAAYMNYISDIYVVQRDLQPGEVLNNQQYKDKFGQQHTIIARPSFSEFALAFQANVALYTPVFLDIDLDYFTTELDRGFVKVDPALDIRARLEALAKILFISHPCKIYGITLALEPVHCGSLGNSYEILKIIDSVLFNNQLLSAQCSYEEL